LRDLSPLEPMIGLSRGRKGGEMAGNRSKARIWVRRRLRNFRQGIQKESSRDFREVQLTPQLSGECPLGGSFCPPGGQK